MWVLALAAVLLVGACASSEGSAGPPTPAAPLDLTVIPAEEPLDPRTAIAGQRCVFLVRVAGGPTDRQIELEADVGGDAASGATVDIAPDAIDEATVAEVTVVPGPVRGETSIIVAITARRGDAEETAARTIPLWPESDSLEAEARGRLATFTDWLAEAHPELGITPSTEWVGSALQTHMLVVSHYLFLSDEWEVALEWHVMIAPSDWGRIILRRRWVEERPSLAFEIPSVSAGDEPREIAPPETVIR